MNRIEDNFRKTPGQATGVESPRIRPAGAVEPIRTTTLVLSVEPWRSGTCGSRTATAARPPRGRDHQVPEPR